MKVAKRFRWEGAHRLPWHTGACKNLHGHSYTLWVELKGGVDKSGMLVDFKDIKEVLNPLLTAWDHATLVAKNDHDLLRAVELLQTKYYLLPYDTTSENLCLYVAEYLGKHALYILKAQGVQAVEIKLQETETCFASFESSLEQLERQIQKSASVYLS